MNPWGNWVTHHLVPIQRTAAWPSSVSTGMGHPPMSLIPNLAVTRYFVDFSWSHLKLCILTFFSAIGLSYFCLLGLTPRAGLGVCWWYYLSLKGQSELTELPPNIWS